MADTTIDVRDGAAAHHGRRRIVRLVVGYGAIASALPYLALKIIWITGGQLGVADPRVMSDASMVALNVATAGMDLVAIAIALAFTHSWGLRLPAWLVLPPMWVASGLLVKFVVGVPLTAIAEVVDRNSSAPVVEGPVLPWVYALVYTEFTGMGIGLMLAFVLYARERWSAVFLPAIEGARQGPTQAVQVPLVNAAAFIAFTIGALHLAWAFGATIGVSAELVAQRTVSSGLLNGADALLALLAALGGLMIVHRPGRHVHVGLALSFAWIGSASLFGWGLWHLINVLGDTALVRDRAGGMALSNLVSLLRLLAGLVIGIVTALVLAGRRTDAAASRPLASPTIAITDVS